MGQDGGRGHVREGRQGDAGGAEEAVRGAVRGAAWEERRKRCGERHGRSGGSGAGSAARCTRGVMRYKGGGALDDIHDCVVMIYRLWADDIHRARRGDGRPLSVAFRASSPLGGALRKAELHFCLRSSNIGLALWERWRRSRRRGHGGKGAAGYEGAACGEGAAVRRARRDARGGVMRYKGGAPLMIYTTVS